MPEILERNIQLSLLQDDMNQAILEPIFFDTDFQTLFSVDTNARTKKRVPYIKFKQNLLRRRTGCKPEEVEAIEISKRCFDIHDQQFRIPLCEDEFEDTIFMGMVERGVRKTDLTTTLMAQILVESAQVAIRKDLTNLAFFGKRSMTPVAGAEYLDIANGLWSFHLPTLQSEGNLQFTNQTAALGAGDAITLLRNVYNNQANVLAAVPANQKYIAVDRTVYEAYRQDLETVQGAGGFTSITEDGKEMLTFHGIPVIPMYEWEDILTTLGVNLSVTPSNFVLLTTRQNLWFGTDSANPRQELEVWYDKRDKINYLDSMFNVGFEYLHDEFFSVGANQNVLDALVAL